MISISIILNIIISDNHASATVLLPSYLFFKLTILSMQLIYSSKHKIGNNFNYEK